MPEQRRLRKRAKAGALPGSPSERAWRELDRMRAAGWSMTAIASATGIPFDGVSSLLEPRSRGRRIGQVRAWQIIRHGRPTEGHVGALGAIRRLRALAVMGWDTTTLAGIAGVPARDLRALRAAEYRTVRVDLADAVERLFHDLCMRQGPSKRSVTIATRRHGWAPPLAWDDIDDPAERPRGVTDPARGRSRGTGRSIDEIAVARAMQGPAQTPDLTTAERRIVVGRLVAVGCSSAQIAAHLGVTSRTVDRDRAALGDAGSES